MTQTEPPWCRDIRPPGAWLRSLSEPFHDWLGWVNRQAHAAGVRLEDGRPIQFVQQARLPGGTAYEHWIAQMAEVPSRDTPHDRLNALVWLQLPRLKARLNAIQAFWIDRCGVSGQRGAWRDWATLLDENGALMRDPSPGQVLGQSLDRHDWQAAMVDHRAHWQGGEVLRLVGHALHEKLMRPFKGITAHVWRLEAGDGPGASESSDWAWWDACAVSALPLATQTVGRLPPTLRPLPVLGVPGWWHENARADFYADPRVFRPPAQGRMMQADSGSDDRC